MNYEWMNTRLMNELMNYESINMKLEYDGINELQTNKYENYVCSQRSFFI